jgi:hypothetical protein
MVAVREVRVPPGPIDIVGIDIDGNIASNASCGRNPEHKRKVVGQTLDYASALWRMPLATHLLRRDILGGLIHEYDRAA